MVDPLRRSQSASVLLGFTVELLVRVATEEHFIVKALMLFVNFTDVPVKQFFNQSCLLLPLLGNFLELSVLSCKPVLVRPCAVLDNFIKENGFVTEKTNLEVGNRTVDLK